MRLLNGLAAALLLVTLATASVAEEVLYEQQLPARLSVITVPVKVDDAVPLLFLDTGSSLHSFDPSLGSHLKRRLGARNLIAYGGRIQVPWYQAPPLTAGAWTLPDSQAAVLNFAPIAQRLGMPIRGLLGSTCFRQTVIDLDFEHQRLRFLRDYRAPDSATPFQPGQESGGMHYLPLEFNWANNPALRIQIEGVTFQPTIDTGAQSLVTVRHHIFAKLVGAGVIVPEANSGLNTTYGAAGVFKRTMGQFTRGNLLGIDLRGVHVFDGGELEGIGLAFLLQFHAVLDLPSKRFYFQRRNCESPLDSNTMLGMQLFYPKGECRVHALRPKGAAMEAGLREGDTILKMAGREGKDLSEPAIYDLCAQFAGQAVPVEIMRPGKAEKITTQLKITKKQFFSLTPPW